MPLTQHSDVYSAVHEDGLNAVIDHLRRKRPSLFNYGTARIVEALDSYRDVRLPTVSAREEPVLCADIPAAPEVMEWDNDLLTPVDPLPVLGTNGMVALDHCFQVPRLAIDFSPDDAPVDVGDQQFAASVTVCGAIACPGEEEFQSVRDRLRRIHDEYGRDLSDDLEAELGLPIVPEPADLHCFCLDLTVVGATSADGPGASGSWVRLSNTPEFVLEDLYLGTGEADLDFPDGMEASITCYVRSFVEFSLLPTLDDVLAKVPASLPAESLLSMQLDETRATVSLPTGGGISNNPAIEDDQLKVFANLDLRFDGGS